MNKSILLILTAAMALLALCGCKGGGSDTAEASSTKEVVAPGAKAASDKPANGMKAMQPQPPPSGG